MTQTAFLRALLAVARKDFRAEARSRELLSLMGLFSLLSILVFSFALELNRAARLEVVGGVLWVTILFASILGLNRGMALEREGGGMDALLIAPIPRGAIFAGKLIGNFAFAFTVGALLTPIMSALYNVPALQPSVIGALALGTLGIATVGTVLAALIGATRARDSLLPILMLPVALPVLIASSRASGGLLTGAANADAGAWLLGLALMDAVYLLVCGALFGFVVEEG